MENITQAQLDAIASWSTTVEAQLLATNKIINLLADTTQELYNINKALEARIADLESKQ